MRGSCLCGVVEYEVRGDVLEATHCHCQMCRKQHGAAFATYFRVKTVDVSFTKGTAHLKAYASSSKVNRLFCDVCGSSMRFDYLPMPEITFLTAGTLNEASGINPTRHIFVDFKVPWLDVLDELPQHGAYPES